MCKKKPGVALRRQNKDAPAANARIGDRVMYKMSPSDKGSWSHGVVTQVGLAEPPTRTSLSLKFKLLIKVRFSGRTMTLNPFHPALRILPPARELKRFDPRNKLRSYAQKHGLLIARYSLNGDVPAYRLLDPTTDFREVFVVAETVEVAALRFSNGAYYNTSFDMSESNTKIVKPRLVVEPNVTRELPRPPGFEPRY